MEHQHSINLMSHTIITTTLYTHEQLNLANFIYSVHKINFHSTFQSKKCVFDFIFEDDCFYALPKPYTKHGTIVDINDMAYKRHDMKIDWVKL